jgi:hypothetical protein
VHVSDPLVEHDRASQRRSTFLVAAIAVIVLAVVVLFIVRSEGPEDQPKVDQPISPSERLAHSSRVVDQALSGFQATHDSWPSRAWTDGRTLRLTGNGSSSSYAPALDEGVRMGWYRGDRDRFAYCLTRDLRALTVVTTGSETTKQERAGACPAASATPQVGQG